MRLHSIQRGWRSPAVLFPILLLLGGCHVHADVSIESVVSLDHVKVDAARIVARGDRVRFTCMQSRSGACYFKVAGPAAVQVPPDATELAFQLAAGQSRELTGLPAGFRHCLDYTGMPHAPDCAL